MIQVIGKIFFCKQSKIFNRKFSQNAGRFLLQVKKNYIMPFKFFEDLFVNI